MHGSIFGDRLRLQEKYEGQPGEQLEGWGTCFAVEIEHFNLVPLYLELELTKT